MWMFWLCAAVLAAAAALLVAARAAAAGRGARDPREDPALAVHRRAIGELDALADRGLLGPQELASARAEAGRRLLVAADARAAPEGGGSPASRRLVTGGAAAAALAALGGYLLLGDLGAPDQPYARRLAGWSAPDRLDSLDPARLAAVLAGVAVRRPGDPQVFAYLGQARMAAGDYGAAATAFDHAARLAPTDADYPQQAGEALLRGAQGKVPPEARAAFREALRRDPKNAAARYQLARARIADGDLAGGVAQWRALAADLPAADPRRAELLAQADRALGDGGLPTREVAAPKPAAGGPSADQVAAAAATAPPGQPEQAAFVRAMVAARAARLRANPDDPAGWALLVRSYGVLGDAAAQAQALHQARVALARRPDALAQVEAQARPSAGPRSASPLGPERPGAR